VPPHLAEQVHLCAQDGQQPVVRIQSLSQDRALGDSSTTNFRPVRRPLSRDSQRVV
jgi:hypothetical protein